MKTTLLTFLFLSRFNSIAQENPWEPKGENPWKNNPANENNGNVKIDTSSVVIDTTYEALKEIDVVENEYSTEKLFQSAETTAHNSYKSGGDFAAGFTFGLFFNFFGFVPDIVYISVDSKREKQTLKKIEDNPNYSALDDAKLKRKVKNTIKTKKGLATIGGTIIGSLAQIGIAIAVFSMF